MRKNTKKIFVVISKTADFKVNRESRAREFTHDAQISQQQEKKSLCLISLSKASDSDRTKKENSLFFPFSISNFFFLIFKLRKKRSESIKLENFLLSCANLNRKNHHFLPKRSYLTVITKVSLKFKKFSKWKICSKKSWKIESFWHFFLHFCS